MWYIIYILNYLIIVVLLSSCVNDPVKTITHFVKGENGALVLCEALQATDSSSITCINFKTNDITTNYFGINNAGQKLGDLANDLIIRGDTVYVSVSGSRTIEAFLLSTGKSIGRIIFPKYVMPRKMAFINDTMAFVTSYVPLSNNEEDYCIYEFNPRKLELTGSKILVGSHPEGITYSSNNNKIYVVNSGFGDFCYPPNESTISIIDIAEKKEVKNIKTENNPNRIYSANGKIYVVYWELPSLQEAENKFGGIIEYDAINMKTLRKWDTPVYDLCFNSNCDTIFYLSSSINNKVSGELNSGVSCIALKDPLAKPHQIIKNSNKNQIWTAIAINNSTGDLWVANSFNFQSKGEIMVYNLSDTRTPKQTYKTGLIPNTIRFY